MIARGAYRRTPSNIASKYKQYACWKLLITAQFGYMKIKGFSLVTDFAKERVLHFKGESQKYVMLRSNIGKYNMMYLGNTVCINGFNMLNFCDGSKRHGLIHSKRRTFTDSRKGLPGINSAPSRMRSKTFTMQTGKKDTPSKHLPLLDVFTKQGCLSEKHAARQTLTRDKHVRTYSTCNNTTSTRREKDPSVRRSVSAEDLRRTSKYKSRKSEIDDLVFKATGLSRRDLATKCLELGLLFENKGWRSQLNIALKSCWNSIERGKELSNNGTPQHVLQGNMTDDLQ